MSNDKEIPPKGDPARTERKVYILEYGSAFLVLHELLGIASYLIGYGLIVTDIVPVSKALAVIKRAGWDPLDYGLSADSKIVPMALTVVMVKSLDAVGLVVLRCALCFWLTPKLAPFIRPPVDYMIGSVRWLFGYKKSENTSTSKS